jgi:hypothetical protein
MQLEAFLFVNWIFWTALAAGTALVVGATELLGGTTRGYRLFMAALLVVLAAVGFVSELNLPTGTAASGTAELRRPLVAGLAAGSLAYLVASVGGWSRRGWLGIVTGALGVAALVALAVAGGTASAPLFAAQLVVGALALGAVFAAMLLGHWYLVTPKLSPAPLRRMMWLLVVALVVQAVGFTVAITLVGTQPIEGGVAWLTWLRLVVGTLLPIGVAVLAILASRAASLQASTGLLYIGLALIMAGSIAGVSLSYLTGVPV